MPCRQCYKTHEFDSIFRRGEYNVQNLKLIRQHHKNCKTHPKGKKFIYSFYNNKIVNMDQFLVICALTQFLVGIEKLSHKQQIHSQQQYFGKIYVNRVHVCYVKLSRKRPNFEKTKPAWTCWDSNTIFTPGFHRDVLFKKSCGKISKGILVSGNMSENKIPKMKYYYHLY